MVRSGVACEHAVRSRGGRDILDTANETDFDDLVKLAAMIFQVPIATVTIVDSHRQWFKAAVGLAVKETSREISFCTHALELKTTFYFSNSNVLIDSLFFF